ncbi:MAG: hypothetical protein AWU54_2203 [Candidatus Frackibacter sp. T328-2]|nr:MAG: hypothetical protein AWU54_2203 [Candidatus Frackibacter sp. T328-2]
MNEQKLKDIVDYNKNIIEEASGDVNNVIDKLITLEYQGHTIWNPLKDETLRYEVNAEEKYGLEKLRKLISDFKSK